jgi:predicted transcriptional regulator of viral defense system
MNKPYYVSLHSAALRHGASHQAVMEHYVITPKPQPRDTNKKSIKIRFFEINQWPETNIQKQKSEAGYYNVSSPALTMADLIHFQNKVGGYNRVYTVLDELKEALTIKDMKTLCEWYPYKSVLQRLGFMLSTLEANDKCINEIKKRLSGEKLQATLLVEKKGQRPGSVDPVWKIDANVKLESDL